MLRRAAFFIAPAPDEKIQSSTWISNSSQKVGQNYSVGTFSGALQNSEINNSGQVAFGAGVMDSEGIIWRVDDAAITQIASYQQIAPDGITELSDLSFYALNDAGQVAILAALVNDPEASPFWNSRAIYRGDGVEFVEIVRTGQSIPDGTAVFVSDLPFDVSLNNAGQVAFNAYLGSGNWQILPNDTGIFRGDGVQLSAIAQEGQVSPDGNGFIGDVINAAYAMNENSQLALLVDLTGTRGGTTDDSAIYLFDDRFGLSKVVREGDAFLGSYITGLSFQRAASSQSGLNNFGQIAYQFSLADGRQGIAIASLVPEPTTWIAFSWIACVFSARRVTRPLMSQH